MRDKDEIRKDVWQSMRDAGVAAFPGAVGRIPNFTGSGRAHLQLAELEVWKNARVLKSNPDSASEAPEKAGPGAGQDRVHGRAPAHAGEVLH